MVLISVQKKVPQKKKKVENTPLVHDLKKHIGKYITILDHLQINRYEINLSITSKVYRYKNIK